MKLFKKISAAILCACLAATLTFSMTACGSDETPETTSSAATVVSSEIADNTSAATDNQGSVQAYLEAEEMQAQLKALKDSLKDSGLDMDVTAEGDTVIYTYTYGTQLTVTDEMKDAMDEALDAQKATFTTLISELKNKTNAANPKVEVRYLNKDGSEILTKTFED